jgi:hypothetical protein
MPSLFLAGFMFPFAGLPGGADILGEVSRLAADKAIRRYHNRNRPSHKLRRDEPPAVHERYRGQRDICTLNNAKAERN